MQTDASHIDSTPKQKRQWLWPVLFVGGVGLAIFLSGLHESVTPNGLHIIRSADEYNDVLKQADDLAKSRLIMVDNGEKLSDDDMAKLRQACKLYDELCVFKPETMGPFYDSGRIHALVGEIKTAEEKLVQAIEDAPLDRNAVNFPAIRILTADSHFYLAQCLIDDNDWMNAYNEINQAIAISPSLAHYYYVRARAEVQLGKLDAAKTDLEHTLELNPQLTPARGLLEFLNNEPASRTPAPGAKKVAAPKPGG